MNVFEFEITIQSKSGDSSWPIVVRCKQPDGLTIHSKETLQLNQEDLNKLTQQQENEREYGTLLGKALFRGAVYDTFVRALSKSSQDSLLRILLSIEAADNDSLKTLHWERLCAPIDADGSWHLLARDQRVPFSLYIPTIIDRRFPPIGRRDLRALVLVASPSNIGKFQLAPFDVEAVLSGVKEALGEIPYEILANDVAGAIGPPTLQELSKQLTNAKKPYTLLHFVAHGKLLDNGETVLYWAKADNQVQPVTGKNYFQSSRNIGNYQRSLPHFTFLCTCESADPRAEAGLGGLGQRLVRNLGMPAVVAMTRKVSVETGLALGQNFYRRLRESGEVDTALQEATAGLGKRHDIAVPALFSRLGGRPLFSDRLDDRELTDEEIEYGIEKLQQLLQERAPNASVLKQRFETQVKTLKNTRGADSRTAREDRHQAIVELNNLCEQVIELSFDALAALGKQPPEYKAECPFPGLSSFAEKKYHKFFFGRDELIRDLQKELAKDNFLAVIGTSGSGKSSVVLAGLIPKLKEEELSLQWAYMTPGKEPLRQLKRRLERLLKVSEQHSILVVDQFEELFTLCEDKAERVEFIEKLLNFAERRKVVITMRADFLGECTFYPELRKRIETRQKLVGPMEPAELITAMKMQADRGGLRFEAGLSHSILNDVQGEPGVMPLLQYALQEMWKRRRGRWLCDEEYQAIGGVQKAIAKTADDFYNSLSVAEQEQVQNIFLRLTRLDASAVAGEKRRDTRRRVELEDLVPTGDDPAVTRKLVQQLAGGGVRLVVTSRNEATGKEEVEVAHEALIRYWPTLQNWLNQNRNDLLLRETINQAAEEWQQHQEQPDKDIYLIHQGGRLEDAEVLWKHPKFVQLNQLEAEYVLACVQLRERRRQLEEQRKQRQLMAAVSAAFVLGGFAILAAYQWRQAEIQQIQALLESAEARLASNQTLDARIGSLRAAKALKQSFWQRLWPDEGLRNQVVDKLIKTIYAGQEVNRIERDQGKVKVAFSKDGKIATSREYGIVSLWDISGKQLNEPLKEGTNFYDVAFTSDGKLLVVQESGGVRLWNISSKQSIALGDGGNNIDNFVLSPDGKQLATVGMDTKGSTVRLWDTKGNQLHELKGGHKGNVNNVAFSPDGQKLVTAGNDSTVRLWGTKGNPLDVFQGHKGEVNSVAFSPKSNQLASGGDDGVLLWDISRKQSTPLKVGIDGKVDKVVFSPDGKKLVVIGSNSTAELWDISSKQQTPLYIEDGDKSVDKVVFSPDGRKLITFTSNSSAPAHLWDISGQHLTLLRGGGQVNSAAFSPDGQKLVTGGNDGTSLLWDLSDKQLAVFQGLKGKVSSVAFRPKSNQLASGGDDGVFLWDISSKQPTPLTEGRDGEVKGMVFSPDGKKLATIGSNSTILQWDISNKQPTPLTEGRDGEVKGMVFSPDGKLLVVDENKGTARLWDSFSKQSTLLQGNNCSIVSSATLSPDGKQLAIGCAEGSVYLGDTEGNNKLKKFQAYKPKSLSVIGVSTIEFSLDGKLLATTGDKLTRLWDPKDTKDTPGFSEFRGDQDRVSDIKFSPDGKHLAIGGYNSTHLLDTQGNELAKLEVSQSSSVAFSPDGKLLLTGGEDGTPRLWQIGGLHELVAMNCDWVRNYLKNAKKLTDTDRHLCDDISTASSSPKK
jgi:WD40 repeat protein/energy-coupling factor transporter ATP-binding protein EcfA2